MFVPFAYHLNKNTTQSWNPGRLLEAVCPSMCVVPFTAGILLQLAFNGVTLKMASSVIAWKKYIELPKVFKAVKAVWI